MTAEMRKKPLPCPAKAFTRLYDFSFLVIPAKAGIQAARQVGGIALDPGLRRGDEKRNENQRSKYSVNRLASWGGGVLGAVVVAAGLSAGPAAAEPLDFAMGKALFDRPWAQAPTAT
ncbi:MAG TPA: hypothetical protein PKZ97_15730, partial [Azospirillaceae bacterium]|nr:hypothetical protein [Azospirillaceae bacterium]